MWPWRLARRNRRRLAQLQRHGLTDSDARLFTSLVRSGRPTPPWLAERLIAAASAAQAAGEEMAE